MAQVDTDLLAKIARQGVDVTLLTAAAATGTAVRWSGGNGMLIGWGTFGGATVMLQMSPDGGTTWLDTNAVLTSAGGLQVLVPAGFVRAAVAGGSGGSISAKLAGA